MTTKNWKFALLLTGFFSVNAAFGQSLETGKKALEMEQYQVAKKTLSKVVQANNNEINNITLGDAYLLSGKPDSAVIYYNQAASKDVKSALGMAAAGKAALVRNNTSEAEAKFSEALKRSKSKDGDVLRVIGSAYLHTDKDLNKAVENLNKAIGVLKTNKAEAYVMLGDAYLKQNKGGEAMNAYEAAIRENDKYALAHLKKGQLSVRSRNYNDAQTEYQAIIGMDQNYAPAYRDLGELYYFVGKYDQALENYKKYVALAENTPATRAVYASFLFLSKDYVGTIKEAEEVLKRDPNNLVMKRLLAYSYYETKQDDKALTAIQDYFKTAPANKLIASDYEYQGKIYNRANKPNEALTSFNRALELDSTRADLRNDMAQIYVKQNNYPKAISLFREKMKRTKPTNTDYYYLGSLYDDSKQYRQADSLYALISANNPTFPNSYLWRARSNANLDPESKAGLAKPHYEKYIELASADKEKNKSGLVEANYYLAYYYYLKNDKTKAANYLKEVRTMDPGNVQAKTLNDVISGKATTTKTKVKTK
jgi:tetratricopeptide (TPR) repeat protein